MHCLMWDVITHALTRIPVELLELISVGVMATIPMLI